MVERQIMFLSFKGRGQGRNQSCRGAESRRRVLLTRVHEPPVACSRVDESNRINSILKMNFCDRL